jgi:alpha-N-arabinofuranosidase
VGETGQLSVDASPQTARKIPDKMFGIFFEVRLREQFLIQ